MGIYRCLVSKLNLKLRSSYTSKQCVNKRLSIYEPYTSLLKNQDFGEGFIGNIRTFYSSTNFF